MGFQTGAFQTPLAFQPQFPEEQNSGGYETKITKKNKEDIFYDLYTGRKLPELVKEAIDHVVKQELPTKTARKTELKSRLPELEVKFLKLYYNILEEANNQWVEVEITRILREQTLREQQEEDNLIIMLLLNSY